MIPVDRIPLQRHGDTLNTLRRHSLSNEKFRSIKTSTQKFLSPTTEHFRERELKTEKEKTVLGERLTKFAKGKEVTRLRDTVSTKRNAAAAA